MPAKVIDKVVDTCGAGDTFTAAVIAALVNGHDAKKAVEIGVTMAGTKVGQQGFANLGHLFPYSECPK